MTDLRLMSPIKNLLLIVSDNHQSVFGIVLVFHSIVFEDRDSVHWFHFVKIGFSFLIHWFLDPDWSEKREKMMIKYFIEDSTICSISWWLTVFNRSFSFSRRSVSVCRVCSSLWWFSTYKECHWKRHWIGNIIHRFFIHFIHSSL